MCTHGPATRTGGKLGADIVVHSTTKYISGHSDVMGGAVVSAREDDFFERVRQVQATYGAVASFLSEHPRVEAVHYPGLAVPEERAIAEAQMSDFGGMLSFQVVGGRQQAMEVAARLQLFTRGD